MKNMIGKNISTYILSFLGGVLLVGTFVAPMITRGQFAEEAFPYEIQWQEYDSTDPITTDIAADLIKPDLTPGQNAQTPPSLIKRLTDYFRLSGTAYDNPNSTSKATDYVKRILNIMLGLISFLSLIMIVFAFYLIFFSKGEEAVGKAKKILIGVGIALAIMWLSRFIASFFFDIYATVTT